jgi:SulP family sulfate permease
VTGLYTALAAMVAYALFGTSRYLNMGPESATAILVASLIVPLARGDPARYAALAGMLALLTGAILLAGWLLRLGVITRLLSTPILTGYLAGSAIVIALNQLPKAFGFPVNTEEYPHVVGGIVHGIADTNAWALEITIGTIVVMVAVQLISKRLPAGFIALVLATVVVSVAGLSDRVKTVGHIAAGLPSPRFPGVGLHDTLALLIPAASVALLVYSGSVLSAQALAARDKVDVDANKEFIGLAAGNVAAGFFGGFPAAASDSRSFLVVTSGGRSQMVGWFGCGLLTLTLLALLPLFKDVPDAALGGVVLVTAAKLINVEEMRRLWRVRRSDFALMAVTFLAVILLGMLGGIIVGVIASLVEMVRRTIQPRTAVLGLVAGRPVWRNVEAHEDAETVAGVIVYRFDAPLFFGNADVLRDQIRRLVRDAAGSSAPAEHVIINAEAMTDLDTTGVEVLERLLVDLRDAGVDLSFARMRTPVRAMMARTGLETKIGADRFYLEVNDAVRAAHSPGR